MIENQAKEVAVSKRNLRVTFQDGRVLMVPLSLFPKLRDASAEARENIQIIGPGIGIHWPDLDEDLSIAGLLAGSPLRVRVPECSDADSDSEGDSDSTLSKYEP